MSKDLKIATCCYCGTRAALVLGKSRHELVCSSCGAPLHDLKRLRRDAVSANPAAGFGALGLRQTARPVAKQAKPKDPRKPEYNRKRKKPKKRKSFGKKLFEEAFDLIEDIFD